MIIDWLKKKNLFKLKGTGPVSFHIGCNFFRDNNSTLCLGPKSYIDRMAMQYKTMFGQKPKTIYLSPLAPNDHLEIDTSDLFYDDGINKYELVLGVLQWTISLGRFDICTAVMTLSGF